MALPFASHATAHFTQQVERAVLDLRCGVPVVIHDGGVSLLALGVDGLESVGFNAMRQCGDQGLHLTLSAHRAQVMGRAARPDAVQMQLVAADSREDVIHWAADPAMKWPLERAMTPAGDAGRAALALLQRGLLLPAALCALPGPEQWSLLEARLARREILDVQAEAVFAHCATPPALWRESEAHVPLAPHITSRFVVFRELHTAREHVAVLLGDPSAWSDPVPVRVHSSCLTGDLFGSVRCDCGSQLHNSIAEISRRGGGVLLYLAQEGRGIGLANKMRTYQIQDDGADTVAANEILGFAVDERQYAVARAMLTDLGVTRIDLLTNNPAKLEGMNRPPIAVAHRSHLYGAVTPENRRYLACKAERTGHWLNDLLQDGPADS